MGLELLVALALAILAGSVAAHRFGLPAPVLLVVAGSLLSLAPAASGVGLPPETVLMIFLPVLLYWESLTTSLREIRRFIRGVVLSGTLLVVVTAAAVAGVLVALGVDAGPAWIIGAALAPTDATAVAALGDILRRRQAVVLQAESLINDGTALVVYSLALSLATGRGEVGPGAAAVAFAVSFVGGIVVGLATGWIAWWIRRRLRLAVHSNVAAVLTPFVAYLVAEQIHASGVLAVVVAGLYGSQLAPSWVSAEARTQGAAFWTMTTFLLNGALFVLVGLQMPVSVRDLSSDSVTHTAVLVVAVYVTLLATRFLFLNLSIVVIRALDRRPVQRTLRGTFRGRVVSTVAGFRGAISLAVALSVPETLPGTSSEFPARDLIVVVTGTVVVLTLVVQGFALPRVVAWSRPPEDTSERDEYRLAKATSTREARDAVPELAARLGTPTRIAEHLRSEYDEALAAIESDDQDDSRRRAAGAERDLRLAMLTSKRATVLRLRDERAIDDTVLRRIQSTLDLEEMRLRALGAEGPDVLGDDPALSLDDTPAEAPNEVPETPALDGVPDPDDGDRAPATAG